MFATPRHCSHLFPLVATMVISLATAAEARHWRYHGYYGFYWPDRSIRQYRAEDTTPRNSPPVVQTSGFGLAVAHMIRACEEQSIELRKMPFDVIARTVRPSEPQQNALDTIRTAVSDAANMLAATCPKDIPAMPSERLDALRHAIDALLESRTTMHPALANFYASLDEEQKARIVVNVSSNVQTKPNRDSRLDADFDNQQHAGQDPVCRQWASILRSWPIRQIEAGTQLSDEQHAALYEVTAAFYHAASGLVSSCPAENPLTPLGRLEAEQKQLEALRQGIDIIQPVITGFEKLLTDAQKTRLDAVVNETTGATAVRVGR
jgi:LTXXQ motif family protein